MDSTSTMAFEGVLEASVPFVCGGCADVWFGGPLRDRRGMSFAKDCVFDAIEDAQSFLQF